MITFAVEFIMPIKFSIIVILNIFTPDISSNKLEMFLKNHHIYFEIIVFFHYYQVLNLTYQTSLHILN